MFNETKERLLLESNMPAVARGFLLSFLPFLRTLQNSFTHEDVSCQKVTYVRNNNVRTGGWIRVLLLKMSNVCVA
jgi:hypothetical protein